LLIEGGFEVRVPHSCEVCRGGAFDFNSGAKNQPGTLDAVDLLLSTVSARHSSHRATVGSGGNAGDESRRDGAGAARFRRATVFPSLRSGQARWATICRP